MKMRAEQIEREEAELTAELDRRIAAAAELDGEGAELLGYDVRAAGRFKHRKVQPYAEEDPRHARFAKGQADALAEIRERIARNDSLLGKLGAMDPDDEPKAG
ncbi:hypothetical protein TSH7_09980 [Azospirillum sp. TSH7]|uniref:hypothetical protein n=1 Tax=unclassified Azospirillum TaxID=2630922 RepID=UPI000D6115CB|nr:MULTISPECIES: hypothetical protein [unclassified Azospirillum]PWC63997.1 hypothetical protein TSH20_19075 [Azospirillum sp. TSH20]PWC64860.1 hypothetical protein TSH7_09980 [Azospirillum sp. TSH7]